VFFVKHNSVIVSDSKAFFNAEIAEQNLAGWKPALHAFLIENRDWIDADFARLKLFGTRLRFM